MGRYASADYDILPNLTYAIANNTELNSICISLRIAEHRILRSFSFTEVAGWTGRRNAMYSSCCLTFHLDGGDQCGISVWRAILRRPQQ
jgi:hypothetical protein